MKWSLKFSPIETLSHPSFSASLNFLTFILSIVALTVSYKSFNSSNAQFEKNSKSSDSMFNLQMNQSRQLNDSLLRQLKGIQKTTGEQSEITNHQLEQEIYAGIPIMTPQKPLLSDTQAYNNMFHPTVWFPYINFGKRPALNLSMNIFIVNEKITRSDTVPSAYSETDHIEPSQGFTNSIKSSIPISIGDTFYSVVQMKYKDGPTKKEFHSTFFFEWVYENGNYIHYLCNNNQKKKLFSFLNTIYAKHEKIQLEW